MLGLDPATRGFEPCSTSYARDSGRRTAWRCACAASGRRAGRCKWKQSQTRRKLPVVAVKVDSSDPDPTLYTVEQYKTQPNKLVKGPAGDLGLTRRHITLKDAETGRWADDFEEQDDWRSLWEEGGLVYDDPEKLDDTYDALNWGSSQNATLLKAANKAIAEQMRSPEWREKHPNFISPPPVPRFGDYALDIPDPELVPHRDWDAWALRAWVEKRRHKEKTDAAWMQRQADIGRFSVLNVSEESDSRLTPLWTTAARTWSHEEIWDLITNSGMNAHPDDIKSLKVQDPVAKADYFVEGCRYVPETEDYLAEIGHWWEDEAEPDLEQEVLLGSEFSDLEGNQADGDQAEVPADDNDDDAPAQDSDAAQLGKYFGSDS